MTIVSSTLKIKIDRTIGTPGNSKYDVDGLNKSWNIFEGTNEQFIKNITTTC